MIQNSTFQSNLAIARVRDEFVGCLRYVLANLDNIEAYQFPESLMLDVEEMAEKASGAEEYNYKRCLDRAEQTLLKWVSCPEAYEAINRACVIYYHNSNCVHKS